MYLHGLTTSPQPPVAKSPLVSSGETGLSSHVLSCLPKATNGRLLTFFFLHYELPSASARFWLTLNAGASFLRSQKNEKVSAIFHVDNFAGGRGSLLLYQRRGAIFHADARRVLTCLGARLLLALKLPKNRHSWLTKGFCPSVTWRAVLFCFSIFYQKI